MALDLTKPAHELTAADLQKCQTVSLDVAFGGFRAKPEEIAQAFDLIARGACGTVGEVLAQSQVEAVFDELERDLVGLAPVKQRIRDIAALLVIGMHYTHIAPPPRPAPSTVPRADATARS